MSIRLRFIGFFVGGLFLFIVLMGVFIMVAMDVVLPRVPLPSTWLPIVELAVILLPFLAGGVLLGMWLVQPLLMIIARLRQLTTSEGHYEHDDTAFYRRNGRIKRRYRLYREALADLSMLSQHLQQSEQERKKLEEAKTNWIAGVSHDLKTPLSYITGYSSLLLDDRKEWSEEEQKRFLHEIHAKSVVIAEWIGDLNLSFKLDALSSSYPLHLKRLDLVDFARRLLADVANHPNAAVYELEFLCSEEEVTVYADEWLLFRALQNLVMNAIHHNPAGTRIKVIIVNTSQQQTVLSVSDNGTGITESDLQHIMERYYRPKEADSRNGGLGLSLVKHIVDAHKWEFHIKSGLGQGTTVELFMVHDTISEPEIVK